MSTKSDFTNNLGKLHDLAYNNNPKYYDTFMDEVFHSMRDYLDPALLQYGLEKFGSKVYAEREFKAGRKSLRDALGTNLTLNEIAEHVGWAIAHFYTAQEAMKVEPQTQNGRKTKTVKRTVKRR